jgi:hypothetical protein
MNDNPVYFSSLTASELIDSTMQKSLNRKITRKTLFKKTALVLLLFGIFCMHVPLRYAQNAGNTVRGIVTDERRETVSAAVVSVKGSTCGVTTDVDGSFSIDVKPEDVLIVTFRRYQGLEVAVGTQTQILE